MSFLDLSVGFGMGALAGITVYNFFVGWKLRQSALPLLELMSDEDIPDVNEEVTVSANSADTIEKISEDDTPHANIDRKI